MRRVGDNKSSTNLVLYTDADFAGSPRIQHFIIGIHLFLAGDVTTFPLAGMSRTQSAMAVSMVEADMSAGSPGAIYELLPVGDVCALLIRKGYFA